MAPLLSVCAHGTWLRVRSRTRERPYRALPVRLCTRDVAACAKSDTWMPIRAIARPFVHTGLSGVCTNGHYDRRGARASPREGEPSRGKECDRHRVGRRGRGAPGGPRHHRAMRRGPWRAGIPLLKADGHAAVDIADRVGLSRKSVMPRVSKAPRRRRGQARARRPRGARLPGDEAPPRDRPRAGSSVSQAFPFASLAP